LLSSYWINYFIYSSLIIFLSCNLFYLISSNFTCSIIFYSKLYNFGSFYDLSPLEGTVSLTDLWYGAELNMEVANSKFYPIVGYLEKNLLVDVISFICSSSIIKYGYEYLLTFIVWYDN
jgi:hypothetical protein